MSCGEECKSNQTWRYLVLGEIALGLASRHYVVGVELLNGIGGPPAYPPQSNSEYHDDYRGSQTTGEKLRGQKGNSPDRRLRSPNPAKLLRKLNCINSQDVGLEAATI